MHFSISLIELGLVGGSVLAMAFYQLRLWQATTLTPRGTAYGRHRALRQAWVERIARKGDDIVIIQNLRNWIMVANFKASTSIIFVFGLTGATFSSNANSALAHELNFLGSIAPDVLLLKVLVLVVLFLAAFFCFSLCLRAMTHAGFMLGHGPENILDSQGAVDELERGAFYYMVGIRCYYMAIPMALWFFGPIWMAIGTAALLAILHRVDR